MKSAGLNPAVLFGAHAGDGAGTPGYIKAASSGGGGSGGGYSGRSRASGYRWSKSQYGAFSGAGAVIGGLAALVTSKSARGAAAGASAGAAIGAGIAKVLNLF
nr:pilot protein for DNA ejection [Microvirus sp.]